MFKPFTLCRRRIQNAMNIFISAMFCREKIIILEHENKMPKEQPAGQESDEVRFCKMMRGQFITPFKNHKPGFLNVMSQCIKNTNSPGNMPTTVYYYSKRIKSSLILY